ncbi:hypothetical protein [Flavobacterium ajazii]|uniref:hypothetical protein n=1 Tax=Flavobacterium ajazii TaxID=2692318 RepID=UPI0013D25F73|nr:hypothetical protein [Flavobacterium ajazii]
MKLIGFIKEHDNITEATEYKSIFGNKINNDEIIHKIINYLNNGIYILGWMNTIRSLDNDELIAPNCYLTDGSFVWPAYYSYYLKKHSNYKIDTNFLEHLEKINFDFSSIKVSDELKIELEKQLPENLKY